ncbi:hypothetical protein VM1G_11350 [Cytospora mali]|uniref:Uncharacterized protein n=1 Tax=Cytospora mali TaxID=578113 RepID=A0A194VKH0_CYTMA|nr:hypothetical protein VM1G_11350 [Valsa mali]
MEFNGPITALVVTVATTAAEMRSRFSHSSKSQGSNRLQIWGVIDTTTTGSIHIGLQGYMHRAALPSTKLIDASSNLSNVMRLEYDLSRLSGADDNMDTVALINQDTKLTFTTSI